MGDEVFELTQQLEESAKKIRQNFAAQRGKVAYVLSYALAVVILLILGAIGGPSLFGVAAAHQISTVWSAAGLLVIELLVFALMLRFLLTRSETFRYKRKVHGTVGARGYVRGYVIEGILWALRNFFAR